MKGKTIPVADDDQALRFLYQQVLSDEGYDVIAARNGKEALKLVQERSPDLVVLDIMMPEMDGLETLPQILRKHGKVLRILHTGHSKYPDEFTTWAADAYVVKSSDLDELKDKIKELLSGSYSDEEDG
jgi:two-component system response regulator (stage 0 sporulation protein F)